jgi:hypothetical protein
MGGIGLEPTTSCVSSRPQPLPKQHKDKDLGNHPETTCTPTCTNFSEKAPNQPPALPQDLADIVDAGRLPESIRSAILTLVRASEHVEGG